jgi:hypothetical protein
MKGFFLCAVLLLIFTGCGQGVKADRNAEELNNYRFSFTPYDNLNVKDKDLFNTVFNIIRNKLVFYVTNTFPAVKTGKPLGLVIELSDNGMTGNFETVMKSTYLRGWGIVGQDMIPVAREDIDAVNSGNPPESMKSIPRALYIIQVDDSTARVYVRYWMLQYRNYDFIYTLNKGGRWFVTKSESQD